jgi:hypothetical protein
MRGDAKISGFIFSLACCGSIFFTGCTCPEQQPGSAASQSAGVCKLNQDAGIATITCEPMDIDLKSGGAATFEVQAMGKDLTYQWFFVNAMGIPEPVDPAKTTGGQTAKLTVAPVTLDSGGFYWCKLGTTGALELPVTTRTRDAQLGIIHPAAGGGGGVQIFPPQQGSMPNPYNGTSTCGTYCGYMNFQNAGTGFQPAASGKGQIKLRFVTTTSTPIDATLFNVRWFDSSGQSGCAQISGSDPKVREFTSNSTKRYVFTVYFASGCPAYGTYVFLDVSFI